MSIASSRRGTNTGSSRETAIMSALPPGARTPRSGRPSASPAPRVTRSRADAAGSAAGIPLADAGEHRGQAHLLPEVEVVVGRGSVGSETHPDAPGQELDEGRDPGGQLGVALRAVGDRDVVALVEGEVPVGQPDAVGGEHPPIEHPRAGQHLGDRPSVLRLEGSPLLLGLGEVDVDQCAELLGDGRQLDERRKWHRVGGVGSEPDLDPPVLAGPAVVEGGDLGDAPLPPALTVLAREPEHTRRDHRSGARRDDRIGQRVLHEVRLAGRGHPEAEELGCGQRHAPVDVARGQMGLPRPEHLLEPPVEGEVLARAAEQGHRRVAVGVDQPGEEDALHPYLARRRSLPRLSVARRSDPGHDLP